MKKMNLFLVGVVLLLGFVGFAYAEVDNVSDSFGNGTVVILNESNVSVVLDGVNETLLDENQTEQAEVVVEDVEVVEDLIIEDVVVAQDQKSFFDEVVSDVRGVVDKINGIHRNLFFILIVILGVLSLFVYSIFFDYSSAEVCFSKASSFHRNGEKAHVDGNYTKAKKLYAKSYLFRKMGKKIVSGGTDDSAI